LPKKSFVGRELICFRDSSDPLIVKMTQALIQAIISDDLNKVTPIVTEPGPMVRSVDHDHHFAHIFQYNHL
jgi:hypothetical protein